MAEHEEPAAPANGSRPDPGPAVDADPQVTLTTIADGRVVLLA